MKTPENIEKMIADLEEDNRKWVKGISQSRQLLANYAVAEHMSIYAIKETSDDLMLSQKYINDNNIQIKLLKLILS